MSKKKIVQIQEGFQPVKGKKGYTPTQGSLDTSKPPGGGSGVPQKPQKDTGKKND